MATRLHWHALLRMRERGVTEQEVLDAVAHSQLIPARKGRVGFRYVFPATGTWRGRPHASKKIIAYASPQPDGWLAITVIVKYRRRKETLQ